MLMGTYIKTMWISGTDPEPRPAYRHLYGTAYLYAMGANWLVGQDIGREDAWMHCHDVAEIPQQIVKPWSIVDDKGDWSTDHSIKISCVNIPSAELRVDDGPMMRVQERSLAPRILEVYDFLTKEEIGQLVKEGVRLLEGKASHKENGYSYVQMPETETVGKVYRRTGFLMHVDDRLLDAVQFVRFSAIEKPQDEEFDDLFQFGNYGEGHILNVLIDLQIPEDGGDLVFPSAELTFPPKAGRAIASFLRNSDNSIDPSAIHSERPVYKGVKYMLRLGMRSEVKPLVGQKVLF